MASFLEVRWPLGNRLTVRGELVLARGHSEEAIPLLQDGINRSCSTGYSSFFLASESLARAWELQDDLPKAVRVLEEVSQERLRAASTQPLSLVQWMRIQGHRAQLLRKLGREEEARGIETELLKLLAYADPDHPLLRRLREPQEQASHRPPN